MNISSEIEKQTAERRTNNFDLLRLIAAMMVMFSHAYVIMKEDANQVMFNFAGDLYFLSSFGLMIFFTISGYLVTQSIFRSDSVISFCWKRLLRIYPAYIILTILSVFALGPVFTSLPMYDYFAQAKTWRFLVENVIIMDSDHVLPGVFGGISVNASAWTLSFEIKLYLMLLALFLTGVLGRRWLFTSVYFLFLLTRMLVPEEMIKTRLHFNPDAYYHLGGYFLTGAAIYVWRDIIKISLWPILISACGWFVCYQLNIEGHPFQQIFFAYLVLWLALKTPALAFPKQDISYGIYIYAWPVQMIVYLIAGDAIRLWQFNAITLPIIFLAGWLSWNLVEKKALAKKYLFGGRIRKGKTVHPAA